MTSVPPTKKEKHKTFGKRTCDREAEHAASDDTEDRPSPANKESSSQFIPTDKDQ